MTFLPTKEGGLGNIWKTLQVILLTPPHALINESPLNQLLNHLHQRMMDYICTEEK